MKKTKSKVAVAKKAVKSKDKIAKKTNKVQKLAKPVAKPVAVKAAKAVKEKAVKVAAPVVVAAPVAAPKLSAKASKAAAKKVVSTGQAKVIQPLSWDAIKPKLNLTPVPKLSKRDKEKEEPVDVKSYSIKARYTVGDRVMHDEFGKGLVRDIIGDFKIRVAFRDFEKVLVHGINN